MTFGDLLLQIINGLSLGAMYALLALGFTQGRRMKAVQQISLLAGQIFTGRHANFRPSITTFDLKNILIFNL